MNRQPKKLEWIRANATTLAAAAVALTAAATISAEAPAADGKPATRRFEMVAYNGGQMMVGGWYLPVVIDLAGLDTGASARPILINHNNDLEHLLGQTDQITKTANQLKVAGRVHAQSDTAKRVVALNDDGFQFQASVGVGVLNKEIVPAGSSVQVNGRQFDGPIVVARKSVLGEVSFVPLGADDSTAARIAATAAKDSPMPFEQWLAGKGFVLASLSTEQKTWLQAQYDAEQTALKAGGNAQQPGQGASANGNGGNTVQANGQQQATDPILAMRESAAVEMGRITALSALGAEFGNRHPAIIEAAVKAGTSVAETKLKLYEKDMPNISASGRQTAAPKFDQHVVQAAISMTAGLPEKAVAASVPAAERERVMNLASASDMRGFGINDLMRVVIVASGGHYHGSSSTDAFARAAFEAERNLAASGFSTISLGGILSNVAKKSMIESYNAVEATWSKIAAVRNHSDFKAVSRYRLDSTGAFKKVGPDGELKHIGLSEAGYTNQLDTFGAMIVLTRQMQINDDLGAFLQLPQFMGRMGALRVEEGVYVLLLSNPGSFFGTGNKNLQTGGGSALNIAGITAAETAFTNQVDSNGKPILVTPKILLVPSPLRTDADSLMTEKLIVSAEVKTQPAKNPHAGKYDVVSSPYLNNTAITDQDGKALVGQSSTAWYLQADPAVRASIAVAFLNGQQTPTIESAETNFQTLGMQWRAYHDFGVGLEDPKAIQKSAGA